MRAGGPHICVFLSSFVVDDKTQTQYTILAASLGPGAAMEWPPTLNEWIRSCPTCSIDVRLDHASCNALITALRYDTKLTTLNVLQKHKNNTGHLQSKTLKHSCERSSFWSYFTSRLGGTFFHLARTF